MISPNIVTVPRIRKTALLRRRSIRDISRDYFGTEHVRFLVVESILFAIMAAVAIWRNRECGRVHKALPINKSEIPRSEPACSTNSEQIAWGRVLCYKLRQC